VSLKLSYGIFIIYREFDIEKEVTMRIKEVQSKLD